MPARAMLRRAVPARRPGLGIRDVGSQPWGAPRVCPQTAVHSPSWGSHTHPGKLREAAGQVARPGACSRRTKALASGNPGRLPFLCRSFHTPVFISPISTVHNISTLSPDADVFCAREPVAWRRATGHSPLLLSLIRRLFVQNQVLTFCPGLSSLPLSLSHTHTQPP